MSRIVIGLWASLFLLAAQDVGATEKEVQEELTQLGTLDAIVEGESAESASFVQDPSANLGPRPCPVSLREVGCYKDKRKASKRAMRELLFQDRYEGKGFSGQKIDWTNWKTYMPELVCRCAQAASAKAYTFFGVQFYGECWSSADAAARFHMYGQGKGCVNTDYKECSASDNVPCVGKDKRNFVYEIVEESESGGGAPLEPVE